MARGGVPNLAPKLQHLFRTIPQPEGRGFYTNDNMVQELANRGVPITVQHLSNLRNGRRDNPSARLLAEISDIFGVPISYFFDAEAVDREPYMAPGLVTPEKAARGKLPTDVWWHTIVPTNGREKTGYPTQKPEGILRRMVLASTRPGDLCLDPFAGSGTLGAVAAQTGRRYVLIDCNPEAIRVTEQRLAGWRERVAGQLPGV